MSACVSACISRWNAVCCMFNANRCSVSGRLLFLFRLFSHATTNSHWQEFPRRRKKNKKKQRQQQWTNDFSQTKMSLCFHARTVPYSMWSNKYTTTNNNLSHVWTVNCVVSLTVLNIYYILYYLFDSCHSIRFVEYSRRRGEMTMRLCYVTNRHMANLSRVRKKIIIYYNFVAVWMCVRTDGRTCALRSILVCMHV